MLILYGGLFLLLLVIDTSGFPPTRSRRIVAEIIWLLVAFIARNSWFILWEMRLAPRRRRASGS